MGDPPRPIASLIGRQLGQYAVKSLIGRGASGTVYLAEDCALHRPVALKVLLGSLARSPEQSEALQQEAQAAAPLRHPNIVRIYAAGVEEGIPYIAMEYVRGEPLDLFLRRQGKLAWQQALHLGRQIVDALAEAHQHGIVHCDVKPANILLDVSGRARLTDFGIATMRQRQNGQHVPSRVIGTLPYMAPEQCRGDGNLTPSTDLYGLGASLYQMISGEPPFVRQSTEAVLNCIYYEAPLRLHQALPEVPDDVSRLVAHLLEKAPEARPLSARDVSRRIAQLLQQNGGRSAFPEAIDAFLRDQMKPRGNHYVTPTQSSVTPRPDTGMKTTGLDGTARMGEWTKVALAALLLLALCGTGYWYLLRPRTMMHLAPPAPSTDFRELSPEVKTAHWPLPHMRTVAIGWTSGSESLLVALEGKTGTLAAGASTLLAVTPARDRAVILAATDGPAQDPHYWQASRPLTALFASSGGPGDEIFLPVYHPQLPETIELRAQSIERTVSSGVGVLQLAAAQAAPRLVNAWTRGHSGSMAVHPRGDEAIVVLDDGDGHYLAALSLTAAAPALRRLSATGAPIVSGSLRYSASGSRLLFQRRQSPSLVSLQSILLGKGEEETLAEGDLEPAVAIAPDALSAAVSLRAQGIVTARLVEFDRSVPPRDLGAGRICAASWHPAGEWIALIAGDGGAPSVILQNVRTGQRSPLLLPPSFQVLVELAVSPDGKWLAAACETAQGPAIAFIDLSVQPVPSGGTSFERA